MLLFLANCALGPAVGVLTAAGSLDSADDLCGVGWRRGAALPFDAGRHARLRAATEPSTSVLGGSEVFVGMGSTINLTCVIRLSPEPPNTIRWQHNNQVSTSFSLVSPPPIITPARFSYTLKHRIILHQAHLSVFFLYLPTFSTIKFN